MPTISFYMLYHFFNIIFIHVFIHIYQSIGAWGVYVFLVFNGVHAENTASSQCSGVAGKMALEEVVLLKP